jgi:sec-independent protein translocase protein TatB
VRVGPPVDWSAVGALDPVKILAVLVIALIVLGPEKLPRVARQLGAAWHELTKFRDKVEQEVREAIPDLDLPRLPARPGVAMAGFIADLTAPIKAGPSPSTGVPAGDGGDAPELAPPGTAAFPSPRSPVPAAAPVLTIDDPSMN